MVLVFKSKRDYALIMVPFKNKHLCEGLQKTLFMKMVYRNSSSFTKLLFIGTCH